MRIIVDAMGGDNAPDEIVKGCVDGVRNIDSEIILVGDEKILKAGLKKLAGREALPNISIQHASEAITNGEIPTHAIKGKMDSSMAVALTLLKQKKGDVLISAGSTGALMAGAVLILDKIKGVSRPALAPIIPCYKGCFLLIDGGSNTRCKPRNLLQFAIMGSIYASSTMGIENPRIGLVNIGREENKGNELTKEAYVLLSQSGLNFVGNIEGRELLEGAADVAVCDGFVGNVIIKVIEGMGMVIFRIMKDEISRNIFRTAAGLMLKPVFKTLRYNLDYAEHGGALLLGVNGPIIKCHGSSDARVIVNTLKQAESFARNKAVGMMIEEFSRLGSDEIEEE